MDLVDNRFRSLIEPIKDLAANWDIDIAESLEDYLEELSTLRISLDDGQTQLNFAEAALLIQGSAAVYSKKVEYLYQLVVQSIEFITKKKSGILRGKKSDDNNSVIEDELLLFGSDPSFLLLDHIIEEGTNIDIKITSADHSCLSNESLLSTSAINTSQVNVSLLHSALHDDQGGAFLKLASSNIDENGVLTIGGFRPMAADPALSSMPPPQLPAGDSSVMDVVVEFDMGMDADGDMDSWQPAADPLPSLPPSQFAHPEASLSPSTRPAPTTSSLPVNPLSRPQKMFVLLDPHSVVGGSRPAKKGRTYKLPARLCARDQDFDPAAELCGDDWSALSSNRSGASPLYESCFLPLLKAKRTVERRVQATHRFHQRNSRTAYTAGDAYFGEGDDDVDGYGGGASYPLASRGDPMMDMLYGRQEHDDVDMAAAPFNGLDRQVLDQFEGDYDAPDVFAGEDGPGDSHSMEDEEAELARRVEAALQNENNYQHNYEAICKQFIDNFHRGAEAFARETQLSKRVNEWTYKLEPLLQAQEEAQPFDIHRCSDQVLEVLGEQARASTRLKSAAKLKDVSVPFGEVVQSTSSTDICRKFLACLQLANLGNVEIVGQGAGRVPQVCNNFELRLLSEKRINELENFRAPSLA